MGQIIPPLISFGIEGMASTVQLQSARLFADTDGNVAVARDGDVRALKENVRKPKQYLRLLK